MPLAILAHDEFLAGHAKTAEALLRYGRDPVTAVIDRAVAGGAAGGLAGATAREGGDGGDGTARADASRMVGPRGRDVPVVPSLDEALDTGPDTLAIGVAPVGGRLPNPWRAEVRQALEAGLHVVSGLHDFLADDPGLARAADGGGATITDVRRPPPEKPIYSGRVLDVPCTVVLTVGTDCSAGKMTTAVEVVRALQARGTNAAFAATGQTGMMIGCDSGVCVDAVPADFVAGHAERSVLEAHERTGADVVVVEGQGALTHPAYGSVSLGLLHGASPQLCVLCHDAKRVDKTTSFHGGRTFPVLAPAEEWALVRAMATPVREPQLIGLAVMNGPTFADDDAAAFEGLPRVDVLADGGAAELANAVVSELEARP